MAKLKAVRHNLVQAVWVVCVAPMARIAQQVHGMPIAHDLSLIWPTPPECAALCLHEVDIDASGRTGQKVPQRGLFVGPEQLSNAAQIERPSQLPAPSDSCMSRESVCRSGCCHQRPGRTAGC